MQVVLKLDEAAIGKALAYQLLYVRTRKRMRRYRKLWQEAEARISELQAENEGLRNENEWLRVKRDQPDARPW